MPDNSTPMFADRPPWTKPGFIAAAVLLGLVVVAGVGIALWPSPDVRQATPAPGAATPAEGGGRDVVQSTSLPTAIPTKAPEDVTWELVGQSAVPVSKSAGPYRKGTTASGFAHTPTGALIATAQIVMHASQWEDRATWEPTITQQFVPSPDRDKMVADLRSSTAGPAQPGELLQIAGFVYQAYSADTAVVGLALRVPSAAESRYVVVTFTVQWRDGDWRMVAPPGGDWQSIRRVASDLVGFVEWGAR